MEKLDKTHANIIVEVYSSFRLSVSTKIDLERMRGWRQGAGPDSEINVLEERVTKRPKQSKDMLKQKLKKQVDLLETYFKRWPRIFRGKVLYCAAKSLTTL